VSEHRTTTSSDLGCLVMEVPSTRRSRPKRTGISQLTRVAGRLSKARAEGRLAHMPTVGQMRAMAWLDGREPCSYLLDPAQNFVPEPMEFGYERELGHHALCFTCRDELGRLMEMVVMRDGGGFDLLGCC
jgi:hypothetical protein